MRTGAFWDGAALIGGRESAGAVLSSSTAIRPPPVAVPATVAIVMTLAARPLAPTAPSRPPPTAPPPPPRAAEPAPSADRCGGQRALLERDRRRDGQHEGHRRALALHLGLERRAGGADGDVTAQLGAPQRAAAQHGELLLDLAAVGVARLARAGQRLAGLEDECLDLVPAHVERHSDLVVGEGTELGEDERRALVLGELLQVGEHVAQVLAALDLGREALDRRLGDVVEGALLAAGAQDRQGAVAGDRVQPGLELIGFVLATRSR
jgi:hypothetical protein